MKMLSLDKELKENSYPGRGIVIGRSADGKKAVTAYFIMGRSENSRNRVFVEDGEGIRTQAFDPVSYTHLGMKGTYIKVLNEVIFDELEEIKAQRNKKS